LLIGERSNPGATRPAPGVSQDAGNQSCVEVMSRGAVPTSAVEAKTAASGITGNMQ
jgi:hypothetical protein